MPMYLVEKKRLYRRRGAVTATRRRALVQRVFFIVLLGWLPMRTEADGKVFKQRAVIAETTIPDQRGLICWSNGIERLVIETRFSGEGTNFAWVVPLPSAPEIEPGTTGVFPTLDYQLRPELIHDPTRWYSLFGFCLAMSWLVISIATTHKFGLQTTAACLLGGVSLIPVSPFIAPFAFLFLIWGAARVLHNTGNLIEVLAVVLLILLLAGLLLPALGTAKGRTATDVTELSSSRVGAFETKTISAKTTSGLLDWLRENGFSVSSNTEPVIADYVKRGWVFVASELSRDQTDAGTNAIHPLSFKFPTEQPVYPMRLTGVDAGPVSIELYVFGNQQAEAAKFTAETCLLTEYPADAYWSGRPGTTLPVLHPLLRSWVQGCPVVTKLVGHLRPADMREDVLIRWRNISAHRHAVYSNSAAITTAANWATGLLLAAIWLALFGRKVNRQGRAAMPQIVSVLVALAVVAGIAVFAGLTKVAVRKGSVHSMFNDIKMLSLSVEIEWKDAPPKSLAEARQAVVFPPEINTNNVLLGGLIHEEDSPGNYIIRELTNGYRFIWYDGNGAEQTIGPLH